MIFGNRKLNQFKESIGLDQTKLDSLPDGIGSYRFPEVVLKKVSYKLDIPISEVESYTSELIIYLIVASEHKAPMLSKTVDILWHEFILCSKDYLHFCFKYFGKFIHHTPNLETTIITSEEKVTLKNNCTKILANLPSERRHQYNAIAKRDSRGGDDSYFWSMLMITACVETDIANSKTSGGAEESNNVGDDIRYDNSSSILGGVSYNSSANNNSESLSSSLDVSTSAGSSSCSSSSCGGD